jgi:hypothetical protein
MPPVFYSMYIVMLYSVKYSSLCASTSLFSDLQNKQNLSACNLLVVLIKIGEHIFGSCKCFFLQKKWSFPDLCIVAKNVLSK